MCLGLGEWAAIHAPSAQAKRGAPVRLESEVRRLAGGQIGFIPHNIFWGKKWLEVNFPCGGKSSIFPQAIKTPFSQTLHFTGKLAILRERESYIFKRTFCLKRWAAYLCLHFCRLVLFYFRALSSEQLRSILNFWLGIPRNSCRRFI